jgi:hypothetical protein
MARPSLPREGLLARRADAETLAQQGEMQQSPEPRVGRDDCEPAACLAQSTRRAMEDAEQVGVRAVSSEKVDYDAGMAEAHSHIHAAHDVLGVGMPGAFDDCRRTGTALLLAEFDHRSEVPVATSAETRLAPAERALELGLRHLGAPADVAVLGLLVELIARPAARALATAAKSAAPTR